MGEVLFAPGFALAALITFFKIARVSVRANDDNDNDNDDDDVKKTST